MNGLVTFLIALAVSYALVGVVGLACKVWFLLFMFGWNLL